MFMLLEKHFCDVNGCDDEAEYVYPFEIWPINSPFKNIACVYIYAKAENKSLTPIYVGQTSELVERMKDHRNGKTRSDRCIRRRGATHILIYQLESKTARIDMETKIRHYYDDGNGELCNKQGDGDSY
jgi:predicted GIY-YIG superfamily endonuclease